MFSAYSSTLVVRCLVGGSGGGDRTDITAISMMKGMENRLFSDLGMY